MLQAAGVPIRAMASGVDEEAAKASLLAEGAAPREIADALAELKATKIGRRTGELTLGSDQTLDLDGAVLSKAEDLPSLRAQLLRLRGRSHKLHAAAVLVEGGEPVWREVKTATLTMRDFSEGFLDAYLATHGATVMGAVGGYHIEGAGLQLFSKVEGDHTAILGLSMLGLLEALRLRGVIDR